MNFSLLYNAVVMKIQFYIRVLYSRAVAWRPNFMSIYCLSYKGIFLHISSLYPLLVTFSIKMQTRKHVCAPHRIHRQVCLREETLGSTSSILRGLLDFVLRLRKHQSSLHPLYIVCEVVSRTSYLNLCYFEVLVIPKGFQLMSATG